MENYIKESKNGFDFAAVSSSSKIVNANRLQIHALAYNIFNWCKRLTLSASMRKQQIDTIRLKLLKIIIKVVYSARHIHSSSVAASHIKRNSMKPWKTSRAYSQIWNNNKYEP